jgi:MarR family
MTMPDPRTRPQPADPGRGAATAVTATGSRAALRLPSTGGAAGRSLVADGDATLVSDTGRRMEAMEESSTGVGAARQAAADRSMTHGSRGDGNAEWPAGLSLLAAEGATQGAAIGESAPGPGGRAPWTLVTNHGLALLVIAAQPSCRISEIARILGITERATIRMINDLVRAGYVARTRIGRRNAYAVNRDASLRHPALRWQKVTALLRLVEPCDQSAEGAETVVALRSALSRREVVADAC